MAESYMYLVERVKENHMHFTANQITLIHEYAGYEVHRICLGIVFTQNQNMVLMFRVLTMWLN